MARGRNWDRHNRNSRAAAARSKPVARRSSRDTFEGLSFYLAERIHEGGNFVVIPGSWKAMTDDELFRYTIAHRSQSCAENREWFDRDRGDRWIRISNETVEAWNIRNCEVCASFVRRN